MPSLFPEDSAVKLPLPSCKNLLIKGPYPPSAPIHLCLSHVSESRPERGITAIILSPSKSKFAQALVEYNDPWLAKYSGTGRVAGLAKHVKILYPPTPLHMSLLLSMFHVSEPTNDPSWNAKTTLTTPPTLIILHEVSSYFHIDGQGDDISLCHPTLSSYLSLVTNALAASSFLAKDDIGTASNQTSLVLFESELDSLRLPILKVPQISLYQDDTDAPGDRPHAESVSQFVHKYFEYCIIIVPESDHEPHELQPASGQAKPHSKMFRLFRMNQLISECTLE